MSTILFIKMKSLSFYTVTC